MSSADVWNRGAAYEPYIGRWSRKLAPDFVAWLGVPAGERWLDVGCGTGALSEAMLDHASPSAVVGIDPSPEFVAHVKANLEDPRATFAVGSAMELDFDDGAFGAAAAGLVLNFVPDPAVAATEMRRVVRPGGTVGAYVWDYAGEMRMLRVFFDAAVELDPEAAQMDEGRRFPLCRPDRLLALFEGAGLQAVEVRSLDVDMDFQDFNDYWNPFLGGQGPAPHYAMSLDSARRGRLRDLIRSRLKPDPDGHIRMVSRSWAVKGTA